MLWNSRKPGVNKQSRTGVIQDDDKCYMMRSTMVYEVFVDIVELSAAYKDHEVPGEKASMTETNSRCR